MRTTPPPVGSADLPASRKRKRSAQGAPGLPPLERARQAGQRFFEAEMKAAERLAPLSQEALALGLAAYTDLCEQMKQGETPGHGPFLETLQEMRDVLLSASEFRWQRTRSSVEHLLEEIGKDDAADKGQKTSEALLTGGQILKDAIQSESPLGISQRRAIVREAARKAALEHPAKGSRRNELDDDDARQAARKRIAEEAGKGA